jgi:hypothetical protein
MIYVNTRVFEFWIMEITNIYDLLHLFNLIRIRLNLEFGGDLAFAHICYNTKKKIKIIFIF